MHAKQVKFERTMRNKMREWVEANMEGIILIELKYA